MRKKTIAAHQKQEEGHREGSWLDLERIASVEVTSENPDFPIESALGSENGPGWRASEKGDQTIRIIFDEPVGLSRISLEFLETEVARTQEFVLRWATAPGQEAREIVRQQWNFSPQGSTTQREEYTVNLPGLRILELFIRPDMGGTNAVASLSRLLVA